MRIYTFIITLLLLIGTLNFPDEVEAASCLNKTAIVYSNGMFTIQEQARESLRDGLRVRLIQANSVFADLTKYDYKLAYANGKGGPFGTTGLDQLLEVSRQAYGDKFMGWFWRALIGDGLISDLVFRSTMQGIASSFNQVQYVDDQDAIKMGNDYRTFLGEGKRILIVAHSQGNFYTNAVYNKLTTENPAWSSNIGVVAVATPANSSPGGKLGLNEPNITVPEDFVIAAVRNTFGSLPPKSDQWILPGSSNVFQSGLSWLNFEQTTLGHSFVGWYLSGTYTRNFILKGITDTINGVNGVGGLQYPTCGGAVITAFAGNGTYGFSGDGGLATQASLQVDTMVAAPNGSLYIAGGSGNVHGCRIRKVDKNGIISTIAGIFIPYPWTSSHNRLIGNGTPAIRAEIQSCRDLSLGPDGSLYFVDSRFKVVRKVDPSGIITTVAGTPSRSPVVAVGDGGLATNANLEIPIGLAIDVYGSIYIGGHSLRKVLPNGIITTLIPQYNGVFSLITDIELDPDGSIYFTGYPSNFSFGSLILKADQTGAFSIFAGAGTPTVSADGRFYIHSPDGTQARQIYLYTSTYAFVVAPNGEAYFADRASTGISYVRKIGLNGIVTTVAGKGMVGVLGDGGPAIQATFNPITDLAIGGDGSLYVGTASGVVRKIK